MRITNGLLAVVMIVSTTFLGCGPAMKDEQGLRELTKKENRNTDLPSARPNR